MNDKVFKTLEFDKIQDLLLSLADSQAAKERCKNISTLTDINKLNELFDLSDAALLRIYAKGKVDFKGAYDLSSSIKRLNASAPLNQKELISIKELLENIKRLQSFYEESDDNLSPIISSLDPLSSLLKELDRCIVSEDEISDRASSTLASIRKEKEIAKARIQTELNRLLNSSIRTYLQDPIVTTRKDRYCLPVKAEYQSKVSGILHDRSASGSTFFIEPSAVVGLNNEITNLELAEKKEIDKVLADLSLKANEFSHELYVNSKEMIGLDFIFAKAALAKAMKATRPILNTDKRTILNKARHPLIASDKVVPINFHIGTDYRLLIITGPNTGGKTVSLKTVGLLTLMAQAGLHIPADEKSEIAIYNEIFADIGDEQSIEQSLSTFSCHMTNIVKYLKNANPTSLYLFDELGAGTDPTEGAALAISILHHLKENDITTIATTHYSELKVYAMTTEGVENAGCEFDINTLMPTYHLLIGVPGKSNAFAISKKLGLSEKLIDDAQSRINEDELKFEDLVADLDAARRQALKEKEEIDAYKKEIASLRAEIAEQKQKTKVSKEKILNKANEEAARILSNAKKTADQAVKAMNKSGVTLEELEKQRASLKKEAQDKKEKISIKPLEKKSRKIYSPADFKVGTHVHVLSMDVEGEILTPPDAKGNCNILMGAIKTKENIKFLEIDENYKEKKEENLRPGLTGRSNGSYSASKIKSKKSSAISPEINLLGLTVDEACAKLDKYLDDVFLTGISEVRIVHGKGTGALRAGIRQYLNGLSYIKSHHLADEGDGGDGVTIASFK